MYTTYSIYGVLALSHQCECVSTIITSITEEHQSRNRRNFYAFDLLNAVQSQTTRRSPTEERLTNCKA